MKFPTMEEFAKNVAEKELDEYEYKGKTLRQWIEIISATELGTDLASLGTNLISRKQAIDALENDKAALNQIIRGMSANDAQLDHYLAQRNQVVYDIDAIKQLPPVQPAEPKRIKGKWRHYEGELECDQCGARYFDEIMDLCGDDVPRFCPNCGADMRGEQNEH